MSEVTEVKEVKVKKVLKTKYSVKKSTKRKFTQQIRVKDEILASGLFEGVVPSLAFECKQEEIINEINHNFKFLMIDNDAETYKKMVNIGLDMFPDNPPSFHFGNLSNIIFNAKEDSFTHCLFDYCNGFEDHKDVVIHVMNNKIVGVGGLVFFTFCLRNNSYEHKKFVAEMESIAPFNPTYINVKQYNQAEQMAMIDDCKTVQAYRTFLVGEIGKERCWQILDIPTYRDGTPMALIILKRIK